MLATQLGDDHLKSKVNGIMMANFHNFCVEEEADISEDYGMLGES